MAKKSISERVLGAAGSASTKDVIAGKLNLSYSYISTIVNALKASGKLKVVKTVLPASGRGRPVTYFKKA